MDKNPLLDTLPNSTYLPRSNVGQVITFSSSGCFPTPDTLALPTRLIKGLKSYFSPTSQNEIPITD